jgi:hypothetical protein
MRSGAASRTMNVAMMTRRCSMTTTTGKLEASSDVGLRRRILTGMRTVAQGKR